jgi:hypothetical protein
MPYYGGDSTTIVNNYYINEDNGQGGGDYQVSEGQAAAVGGDYPAVAVNGD